jgi:hypothetical protein
MVPQINYLAVVLAMVASMVVGFVYYHPAVMGRRWMALAGHPDGSVRGSSPMVYPVVALASFITAWVLAGCADIAHEFYGGSFLSSALLTAWILWAGFTAARILVHDLFDTRPRMLTVVNVLHELLTATAMGLVIGLLAP